MSVGTWLGLLGLIAVPIVVLIYLIKSKYVPKTVSSTFIWQRSLKYMKRRVPINFIMSFLLIMQLLVVAAASLALLNISVEPKESTATIVIIDASSSMNAKNGTKTRYEVAIDKVKKMAKDVDTNKGMVIIFAGDKAEQLTRGTSPIEDENGDRDETPYVYTAKEALDAVNELKDKKCAEGNVSIDAALKLARDCQALDKNENTKIYLLTDKDFKETPAGLEIVHCNDVERDWNVGITDVDEKYFASGYQFEVTVSNQGSTSYIYKNVYLGYNRLNVTENMIENGTATFNFMPSQSTYYNPTYRYIILLDGKNAPCSIVGYDKYESEDEEDAHLDGTIQLPNTAGDKSKYPNGFTLEVNLEGLTPGEYALTVVEQAEKRESISQKEEEVKLFQQQYDADLADQEDIEFAPATLYLNLYIDGQVTTKEILINWGGKDTPKKKKFIFTSKTGNVSDDTTEYFIIKPVMKYTKARFALDTMDADVISEDNESYLGSVPNVEAKILYVSNNIKIKNGAPDLTKRTTLQIALTAVGYQIDSSDIYHSSSVKRAPTSGYTLYIYEGVVPPIIPTDGTVWFLNVPEKDAERIGLEITLEKDSIVEGNTNGYEIIKSSLMTGDGKDVDQITQKIKFETIKIPGQSPIKPVTSRYGVVGTIQEIKNPQTGITEIDVNVNLPKGFESVYDAVFYKSTGNETKKINTPIMMVGDLNGTTKTIITTFDFADSSLPVFISDFPILVKNMVEYSLPEILTDRTYNIGETLEFNKPNGAETIKVNFVPNMTLYDAYVELYEGFKKAKTMADRGKDIEAILTLEKTLTQAGASIDGFPESAIREDLSREDGMWLVEEKLQKSLDFYEKKYKEAVDTLKKGGTISGQSIRRIQVASWSSSSLSSLENDGKLPTVVLDRFGTYDIVVTFKAEENLSNPQAPVVQKTETYTVTTFLPLSECDITERGSKLETDISYQGAELEVIEEVVKNPIMPWVVLVLIVLLIIEWGVYYRDEY